MYNSSILNHAENWLEAAWSKPFPNEVYWLRTEDITKTKKNVKKFVFFHCHVCAVCMCTCVGTYVWVRVSVYVYMCMWRPRVIVHRSRDSQSSPELAYRLISLVLEILCFNFWAWNYKQTST